MAVLLDFMMRVSNASLDDACEDIVKMADPGSFATKRDMEDHFERVLGYDPIEYFPRKFLEDKLRELTDIAPFSVREKIYSNHEAIISQALECVTDLDTSILSKVLNAVVEYNVGWSSGIDDGVKVEDCISMSLYGENYESAEDEAEYSDDSDDDEYSGDDEDDSGGFCSDFD